LIFENNEVGGVKCLIDNKKRTIRSKIVIGADGVESRIGRRAKIDTTIAMRDMETCAQMTLANLAIDDDTCVFYFSQEKFPGGYAWIFPKGDGSANVGLGIAGNKARKKSAGARLEAFVAEVFPAASVLTKTVGGVPCANRPQKITAPGLLLAGDAAMQTNPISGGGIATGMTAGRLAGKIAAESIKSSNSSLQFLATYEKEWDRLCGNNQKRYYRLKSGISKLSDEQLNKTAAALKKIPQKKQTLVKIFQTALIRQPALMMDILRTLSPFSNS
jgi:digeranylgeranylglycerophospholipid reductase